MPNEHGAVRFDGDLRVGEGLWLGVGLRKGFERQRGWSTLGRVRLGL